MHTQKLFLYKLVCPRGKIACRPHLLTMRSLMSGPHRRTRTGSPSVSHNGPQRAPPPGDSRDSAGQSCQPESRGPCAGTHRELMRKTLQNVTSLHCGPPKGLPETHPGQDPPPASPSPSLCPPGCAGRGPTPLLPREGSQGRPKGGLLSVTYSRMFVDIRKARGPYFSGKTKHG